MEQCIGPFAMYRAICAINRMPAQPVGTATANTLSRRTRRLLAVRFRQNFHLASVCCARSCAKARGGIPTKAQFDSCLSAQCSIQTPSNSGIIRRRCGIAPFDFRPCRIPTQKRQESTPQSILARTRSRFAPSASYPHVFRSFCCASPNAGHTGCCLSLQSQSAGPTRGSNAFCPSRRRGMHSKRDPRDCRHASYVMVIARQRVLILSATLPASSIFTTSAIGALK